MVKSVHGVLCNILLAKFTFESKSYQRVRLTINSNLISPQISVISDHHGPIDPKVFEKIFTALKKRQSVTFDYRPLQKTTYMLRNIDPYHAICQHANWYIIGYCYDKKEPRMFSFSRVKNVKLTKNNFVIPKDFKAEKFFDKEMGVFASSRTAYTIELLIASEIGTYALERRWHNTQKVEQRKDGSVYVKFTTTQIPEVLRWVLGQGHTVKVLNPPEIVKQVKDEVEKVRRMYK
jgi:predicted DNA-binding transcriptional regulator YafY